MSSFSRISIPFSDTNSFDKLILDYLKDDDFLRKFYLFEDSFEGIKERIESYHNLRLNRKLLKEVLLKQYKSYNTSENFEKVHKNILSVLDPSTFTSASINSDVYTIPLKAVAGAEKLISDLPP